MPSSVIRRFAYDATDETLFITFVSGRTYAYERVPADVHAAFCAHSSKGGFFNAFIRDRFAHHEVVARPGGRAARN